MNETWNQNTAGCAALCCVGSSVIWWVMIKVETAAARSHERRQQDILGWIMVSGSQAAPSARASYESIMDNKVFYIWYLHPSTIQSFLTVTKTEATNVYSIQKYLNVYSQCRYNVKWSATILSRSKTQIRSARHTADTWQGTRQNPRPALCSEFRLGTRATWSAAIVTPNQQARAFSATAVWLF